jgi:site-specific DNA-cytosine methylase
MTLTVTDLFCGAGGSSHGAELADSRAERQGVCGV